jgi:osmotically-inducible protein OsmY
MTAHTLTWPFGTPGARRPDARSGAQAAPAGSSDDQLRAAVLARLATLAGWEAATSNVYVERGTVVLQGLVRTALAREAGRRIAAGVPGVQRVRDTRVLPRD